MDKKPRRGHRSLQRATVVMADHNHVLRLVNVKMRVRHPTNLSNSNDDFQVVREQAEEAANAVLIENGEDPARYDYVGTLCAWTSDALNRGRIEWAKEVPLGIVDPNSW